MLQSVILFGLLAVMPVAHSPAADKPSDEFVQMIVKLISDSDKEFRAAGLEQVRTSAKGADATRVFVAQLAKLDASGQTALISALADRGDKSAHPALVELATSSKEESVRAAAIVAIGDLGSTADLSMLTKVLSSSSSAEQAAARRSLVLLRGEGVSKSIAAEMKTASPAIKSSLIEVLGMRRASDESPALIAASVEENAQVRGAAMAALGNLGRSEQIAAMLPGILKAEKGGERDNAERCVALVCARIDKEEQRGKTVIDAIQTVSATERDELLPLVGRVGGKTLIDFVAGIATGSDSARRRIGIDALSKWPDSAVSDKLLEIVNKSTDATERHQAFQAYVKNASTRDNKNDKVRLDRMKEAMKIAQSPEEKTVVITRTRTSYDVDAVRFILPYVDQPEFAQIACETVVEIAHHRQVRDPNKAEFDTILDKVIEISKDPVVVERAQRYKRGETWERPKK